MPDDVLTFRAFIANFTDFLTVAVHTILYERDIYPPTSFLSAKKYNFAVRQNRHPKVCEWINDAVNAVEAELLKGSVDRVAVVIYNKHNKPLERFVFDVSRFPTVSAAEVDIPLRRLDTDEPGLPILPTVDMEEQFRATMHKLSNCSNGLNALPKGCTFTVAIELKGAGHVPIGHPQPWVPAEAQAGQGFGGETRTRPVRAVAAGEMIFETWIEEVKLKANQASVEDAEDWH